MKMAIGGVKINPSLSFAPDLPYKKQKENTVSLVEGCVIIMEMGIIKVKGLVLVMIMVMEEINDLVLIMAMVKEEIIKEMEWVMVGITMVETIIRPIEMVLLVGVIVGVTVEVKQIRSNKI